VRDLIGDAQGVTSRLKDGADGLIAATAPAHRAVLLTRDATMTKCTRRADVEVIPNGLFGIPIGWQSCPTSAGRGGRGS
jgi:hypothetical protein